MQSVPVWEWSLASHNCRRAWHRRHQHLVSQCSARGFQALSCAAGCPVVEASSMPDVGWSTRGMRVNLGLVVVAGHAAGWSGSMNCDQGFKPTAHQVLRDGSTMCSAATVRVMRPRVTPLADVIRKESTYFAQSRPLTRYICTYKLREVQHASSLAHCTKSHCGDCSQPGCRACGVLGSFLRA